MTEVQELAQFVATASFDQLSADAVAQLKIRVLDTIGVAIGALGAPPMVAVRALVEELGGTPQATMIGGGMSSIDRVAFVNVALSRYLDFMDAYLAKGETCHPSDNLGAVLAAGESVDATGAELLTALAVAYQVQSRLSDVAPVRAKGFDHTVQGAYASAAAVAKALRLTPQQTANAIAISGTANNALRVTRTGNLSNWKGLAYPNTAKEGTFAALLASRGITGPELVFEGNKGFHQSIAGPFEIDWSAEDLERVRMSIVKKHNAEIHSQSALDAALDVRAQAGFDPQRVTSVRLRTFGVAYSIIGGGEEGDKHRIRTKEEADHSLPYLLAAALLDGVVTPAQFTPERIVAGDIQRLLALVEVTGDDGFSARFPAEMPAELEVTLAGGTVLRATRSGYEGFHTDPMSWDVARAKFDAVAAPFASGALRDEIAAVVRELEHRRVRDLTRLFAQVRTAASAAF
ncbi:MmgE/PrpD family protein [Microbacterium kribbense]|uniref:MmgE/PrpD family protein n=1 Tax=Microbacterium kribbense TaxID=433645 RepID=A0ABP7GBU6_9MICO